ncbi:MAG: hypothetical protein WCJ13_00345 [Coriobacteriia bacterium]
MVREPERRAAALAAGVSAEDLVAVETLLEKKAHREFTQFSKLAREHPAGELLPALLLPLSRVAEPQPAASPAVFEGQPHAAAEGDSAAGSEPQALVVAGEIEPPPLEIPIADFGGFAIEPPIVVGAEPWALRPRVEPSEPVAEPEPEPPALAPVTSGPAEEPAG